MPSVAFPSPPAFTYHNCTTFLWLHLLIRLAVVWTSKLSWIKYLQHPLSLLGAERMKPVMFWYCLNCFLFRTTNEIFSRFRIGLLEFSIIFEKEMNHKFPARKFLKSMQMDRSAKKQWCYSKELWRSLILGWNETSGKKKEQCSELTKNGHRY